MAIRQLDCLLDTTSDGLPATPCRIDTIGSRRGNGDGASVRIAIRIRVRTDEDKSESGD